ncbi:MAG TPA: CarD family transcriptional regulator, partial [Rhodocyclaceae bacterium]|nr:CarD family transcriptional regulator [Rhodocyclaceae bacterium]
MPHAPLLPSLSALPKPGQRLDLPALPGSADALALARLAGRQPLVVVTASAGDAQRLLEEIPWFAPDLRVRLLPDWETLPYDHFSPHHDLVSERLATLWATLGGAIDVLLVPATTAVVRLAPTSFLAAYTFAFKRGEKLDAEAFRGQVTLAGYTHVTQVVSPGEYSIRGGLIDLFPMGSTLPFRLDLFDNEIESIRTFDIDTQRTLYPVPEICLLPAREFPMDDKARTGFRQRFREVFEGDPAKSGVYKDVSSGIASAGIEYYLPLFFEETATLFDYLPAGSVLVTHGDAAGAIAGFWADTQSRYNLLQGDKARPLLPPTDLFLSDEAFFTLAKPLPRLHVGDGAPGEATAIPKVAVERRAEDPLAALKAFAGGFSGRVLLLAETAGRRETLGAMLAEHGVAPAACASLTEFLDGMQALALTVGPLQAGFALPGLAFVTETELFAGAPRRTRREAQKKASFDNWLKDLTELKVGDPVVHENHGIGRYQGLVSLDLGEGATEFLELHYANQAKLFVPVSQLHVISRYSGADPEAAPVHTLGSGQWEKAKKKAAEQARDTAA